MIMKQIMKKTTSVILFICVLLLSVASGQAATACDNGANIMPSSAESQLAQLSKEELKWFNKFMTGGLLVDGWTDITKKILANTAQKHKEEQRQLLEELGVRIGMEWSRGNAVRRVDTDRLIEWGERLKVATKKQPERLPEVIASIDKEVNSLLN